MTIDRILIDLKAKRRALDTAIAALESLQKRHRERGGPGHKKHYSASAKSPSLPLKTWVKAAVGAGSGELIPFPAGGRRARSGRDTS